MKFDRIIGVAGFIVAIASAIFTWISISSSPQEDLIKLGYRTSSEELWHAVSDRNVKAVQIFAKTGVKMTPVHFTGMFLPMFYDQNIVDAVIAAKLVDDALCPTAVDQLTFYSPALDMPKKAQQIRKICGTTAVIATIGVNRDKEKQRIDKNALLNRERPQRVKACQEHYASDRTLVTDAVKFNIVDAQTLSERQCILASINMQLVFRTYGNAEFTRRPITECCESYNQILATSTELLEQADQALKLLAS